MTQSPEIGLDEPNSQHRGGYQGSRGAGTGYVGEMTGGLSWGCGGRVTADKRYGVRTDHPVGGHLWKGGRTATETHLTGDPESRLPARRC